MSHSTLYLHIGLIKTGTTFIQKEVLPVISSLEWLVKPKSNLIEGMPNHGVFALFFKRSPAIWDELGEKLFEELFGDWSRNNQSRNVLISDEDMGVNLHYPCSFLGSRWTRKGQDPFGLRLHIEKLSNISRKWGFSRIKILVTIRRQDTWMASAYSQRSGRIPNASQKQFENHVDALLNTKTDYYESGVSINYLLLYQELIKAVGANNILMLPFELLQKDPGEFLKLWFNFLDIQNEFVNIENSLVNDANTKKHNENIIAENKWIIGKRTFRDSKYILRLYPRSLFQSVGVNYKIPIRWPEFGRGTEIVLTTELSERILSVYEKSNSLLSQITNLDLSEYGYHS